MIRATVGFCAASAIVLGGGMMQPARAEHRILGVHGDWTAQSDGTGAELVCYVGSAPKTAEGAYTRRGETFVLVSHRPSERVIGEASVTAGYTYKEGLNAQAEIDGKVFLELMTRGGTAWAADPAADRVLVAAMKAGRQMIVRGTSSRGTLTTDTYSLRGFTAAYAAIDKACAPE